MPPASLLPPSGKLDSYSGKPHPGFMGLEGRKLTPTPVPGVGGWITPNQSEFHDIVDSIIGTGMGIGSSSVQWRSDPERCPKPWAKPSPWPGSEPGKPKSGAAGGHLATMATHREKPRGWMRIMSLSLEDICGLIDQAIPETHSWNESINSLFWHKPCWARLLSLTTEGVLI